MTNDPKIRKSRSDYPRDHPELVRYREEMKTYEGFYITDSLVVRRKVLGGVHQCSDLTAERVVDAAKFALEVHNKSQGTSLELKKIVRANYRSAPEFVGYITLQASDDNFYETFVWIYIMPGMNFLYSDEFDMSCCDRGQVNIFRPAIHYP